VAGDENKFLQEFLDVGEVRKNKNKRMMRKEYFVRWMAAVVLKTRGRRQRIMMVG
jgi:hypothetical protein